LTVRSDAPLAGERRVALRPTRALGWAGGSVVLLAGSFAIVATANGEPSGAWRLAMTVLAVASTVMIGIAMGSFAHVGADDQT
jgi:hypothetical protein